MKTKIVFLVLVILFCMANIFSQGGTTGPLTWKIENGTLTISGNGDMPGYAIPYIYPDYAAPWFGLSGKINTVIIENGVTSIGNWAFPECALLSISIPKTVSRIGSFAFQECSNLASIVIPEGVTSIGLHAFSECGLTSVILPSTLSSIDNAFTSCPLKSITNLNPVPIDITSGVFRYVNISACKLYVPKNSVPLYKKAPVWRDFIVRGIPFLVDIDEVEDLGGGIIIYPNPTTGTCTLTIPEEFLYENHLTLSIYAPSGKLLQQIPIKQNSESFPFQIEQKAAGVYPVVLSNGKRSFRGKIVFE
jgi:hypothetical protein